MTVTVLFFASIAEAAGTRRLSVPVEGPSTVAEIRDYLVREHPQLERFVPTLMYAVNEEYARPGDSVPVGATLALIPPVSGG